MHFIQGSQRGHIHPLYRSTSGRPSGNPPPAGPDRRAGPFRGRRPGSLRRGERRPGPGIGGQGGAIPHPQPGRVRPALSGHTPLRLLRLHHSARRQFLHHGLRLLHPPVLFPPAGADLFRQPRRNAGRAGRGPGRKGAAPFWHGGIHRQPDLGAVDRPFPKAGFPVRPAGSRGAGAENQNGGGGRTRRPGSPATNRPILVGEHGSGDPGQRTGNRLFDGPASSGPESVGMGLPGGVSFRPHGALRGLRIGIPGGRPPAVRRRAAGKRTLDQPGHLPVHAGPEADGPAAVPGLQNPLWRVHPGDGRQNAVFQTAADRALPGRGRSDSGSRAGGYGLFLHGGRNGLAGVAGVFP